MADYNFDSYSPEALHDRFTSIREEISACEGGTKNAPIELLREFAALCAVMRRKNAGPPKKAPNKRMSSKMSEDELGELL